MKHRNNKNEASTLSKVDVASAVKFGGSATRRRKLRDLALEKLDRNIQGIGQAHSPVEDARAALQLYKIASKEVRFMHGKFTQFEL